MRQSKKIVVDSDIAADIAQLVYHDGFSLREAGREYGVSHEYVRMILWDYYDHDYEMAQRQQRKELEEWRIFLDKMREQNLYCALCGGFILRVAQGYSKNGHYTCSPEHAEAWATLRLVLCADCRQAHLESCEATWRKDPVKYAAQMRYLDSPKRGTYPLSIQRGSLRHKLLEKYRPEMLEVIPFSDEIDRPQWIGNIETLV